MTVSVKIPKTTYKRIKDLHKKVKLKKKKTPLEHVVSDFSTKAFLNYALTLFLKNHKSFIYDNTDENATLESLD